MARRGSITDSSIPDIISKYLVGISLGELAFEHHVRTTKIRDILIHNNIRIRGRGEQVDKSKYHTYSKYTWNDNYFETIDTIEKAYWLGFLYADGNVFFQKSKSEQGGTKGARIEFSLKKDDKYMLYNFINSIDGNMPIKDRIVRLKGKEYDSSRVFVNSVKMANDLIDNGCVPCKSLLLKFPSCVPEDMLSHFIRGYFDGDGCVVFYRENQLKQFNVSMLGTMEFLTGVQQYLHSKGIDSMSLKTHPTKRMSMLILFGIANYKKFFDVIYDHKTYYLERKYNLFVEALNHYKGSRYLP